MSITLSGLIIGLVFGRVLAGIISQFTSWRDAYWLAVGLQGGKCLPRWIVLKIAMLGVMWVALPDTPDKDIQLSYVGVVG